MNNFCIFAQNNIGITDNFMNMKQKVIMSVLALMMGCQVMAQKSIVILYENDAHCGLDGYTKIAGLRDAINKSDTAYAAAVCCGDFLQGNTTGAISKGQYIADILRLMDYHALTLGNHEFDYGVPRMRALLEQAGTPVVCANFYEAGEPEPVFAPYVIHQYGDKRVAYIGACTPETMISLPSRFWALSHSMISCEWPSSTMSMPRVLLTRR